MMYLSAVNTMKMTMSGQESMRRQRPAWQHSDSAFTPRKMIFDYLGKSNSSPP